MSYKPVILNYKAKEMFDKVFDDIKTTYGLIGREFIGGEIQVVYSSEKEIVYRLRLKDVMKVFESEELELLNQKVMKHFLEIRN